MEVFDHIVSDIEAKMGAEKLDFEPAFYKATVTWNKHLIKESSFYFGLTYSLPKIVLEKAKKVFKKWYFSLLPTLPSFPIFCWISVKITFSQNAINDLKRIFTNTYGIAP